MTKKERERGQRSVCLGYTLAHAQAAGERREPSYDDDGCLLDGTKRFVPRIIATPFFFFFFL